MINPLEALISFLAPHRCISCGSEPALLCQPCLLSNLVSPPSRCYLCHKATSASQVCKNCRSKSGLKNVWVAAEYGNISKKLVHKLKFERAKSGANILAQVISENLPDLPADTIVTNVPTANKRVRSRGYDQSKLIAKALALKRGWRYEELLLRKGSSRQVGASRKVRKTQLQNAFSAKNNVPTMGKILLVDDITTTGATLEAAAKALKAGGAKNISGAVFAQPANY